MRQRIDGRCCTAGRPVGRYSIGSQRVYHEDENRRGAYRVFLATAEEEEQRYARQDRREVGESPLSLRATALYVYFHARVRHVGFITAPKDHIVSEAVGA